MQKHWEGSVYIDAPAEEVFAYLTDVTRHPDWDAFTEKVELRNPGNEHGVGAEWKVYERLNLFSQGKRGTRWKNTMGVAHREMREIVPYSRVAWHTHPVPAIGINADFTFELEPEGEGTRVKQTVQLNIPGVIEFIGRPVEKRIDPKQRELWQASLEQLKAVVEANARVPASV